MTSDLPEKLYYSISEVAQYTDVRPHVLRYWESEFPTLRPRKNRAGNRSYRRKDIEEVLAIKHLLYDAGYKIDGARRVLREGSSREEALKEAHKELVPDEDKIARARKELAELLELIRKL